MSERKRSDRFSLTSKPKTDIPPDEITEQEKLLVREVWMQVESNYIVISKALFAELFTVHPEYKNFFKDLLEERKEDPWMNPRFERHMIQVLLPSLGSIVLNMDRPQVVREQMIKLGKVHLVKNMRLKRKNVETLRKIFFETVKRFLGGGMRKEHEVAMRKVFGGALHVFEDALEGKIV